jgi:hypothetical protein
LLAVCRFVVSRLEHDPEKWNPVFRKDHASLKVEHDPEKRDPGFPKSMPSGLIRGIVLKQKLEQDADPS